MVLIWGSSERHVAFNERVVAAIMLSAIGISYLCLSSADVFAISVSTFTVLKSFSSRFALSFAVWRPSLLRASW